MSGAQDVRSLKSPSLLDALISLRGGAFMSAVLGVSTVAYLPFAPFNIFSPALSVTGFRIIAAQPVPDSEGA
ncbi:hypothetical protein [Mycolicibacterium confluentis]|uniref:Uncharacterized protein n=1 Tax=Mycolicibacterium confluentis TaxID=28047 RepID=A0A7I7Y2I3_9MYCO|nr:hypothetical protein [Mycolicibacterium confluentis]MCV7320195.1 hypothetical protein [Mycolicibacterium confluentis]ORV34718.1 hypothetical protein AWB99_03770 [Mycolicibacterium confluentis]BBZ35231.1 hypothetical protein MCNF_38360 [Mycolicibacterium confluentis]